MLYFLLLFFTSAIKDEVRDNFDKTYIEVSLERTRDKNWRNENGEFEEYRVRVINYTQLKLNDIDYKIVKSSRNLARLGLEFISSKEIESHARKIKQFLAGSTTNGKN